MNSRNWIGLSLLLSTAGMAACGGGGNNPPVNPDAATVDAGSDAMPNADAMQPLPDLGAPESVVWDADNKVWYVSNIWGDPTTVDGVGWITRLDPFGEIMDAHWVERLNAPKGMALHGGKLYVADITELVIIDTATGAIGERIQVTNAQFLNGVAAGSDGTIYTTDTLANAIFSYVPDSGQEPALFAQDAALNGPSGVLVEDQRLVVTSFGAFGDNADVAQLSAIDLGTKAITQIGTLEGKLDSIVADGDRYIVSDIRGPIHTVQLAGGLSVQARDAVAKDGLQSAAGIGFDPVRRIVAIPDTVGSQVVLVSLDFDAPESAFWDAAKNVWYVSNMGDTNATQADGVGWISRLDASGKMLDARWVDGLDAPTGMAMVGSRLYVADIDKIVPIDIDASGAGTALTAIPVTGAQLLNDMAAGTDGTLYFTDTLTNTVHRIVSGQAPEVFVQDAKLKNPNGILVEDSRLVVASVGSFTDLTDVAPIWAIDLGSKAITQIGTLEGKFDGIALIQAGAYIVSDFRGELRFLDDAGEGFVFRNVTSVDYLKSAADIGLDPVGKILAIPDVFGNSVVFVDMSSDI